MRRALLALTIALAAACTGSDAPPPTTAQPTTSTTMPPTTTTTRPDACPLPARAEPDPKRPRYTLRIDVRPSEARVVGETKVTFTPDLDVDRLVFRLWPNGPRLAKAGASLTVSSVRVGADAVTTSAPDPSTLVVPLAPTVRKGGTVEATLSWELKMAGPNNDRVMQAGDSFRLGSFFPILAWEPGVGWATDPPTGAFAEASMVPTADFDTTVTVPAGLEVMATGMPDVTRTRWTATAVRDVAVTIGRFRMARRAAEGVEIEVGVAEGLTDSAEAYANKLAAEMHDLVVAFGPYPWPAYRLSITPHLNGGIEYPMHVMQGPGTNTRTTSHELGHQWFYGLVGNNQGRDPWLDEGLATYAEFRAEGRLGELASMQQQPEAVGHLTSPMSYWEQHQAAYYRGVYVQGAQALTALGPADRVDCALRVYIAGNAHRIARPADLSAAAEVVFADARAKLAAFGVTSAS